LYTKAHAPMPDMKQLIRLLSDQILPACPFLLFLLL
jgi:hypothetical protein